MYATGSCGFAIKTYCWTPTWHNSTEWKPKKLIKLSATTRISFLMDTYSSFNNLKNSMWWKIFTPCLAQIFPGYTEGIH